MFVYNLICFYLILFKSKFKEFDFSLVKINKIIYTKKIILLYTHRGIGININENTKINRKTE